MKKIIGMLFAILIATSAFAFQASLGVRGNANFQVGTTVNKDNVTLNQDAHPGIGGGFGVYTNLGFVNFGKVLFGIRPEFDMNFKNGFYFKKEGSVITTRTDFTTDTIDIPVLITFGIPFSETLKLDLGAGPYISFPFNGWKSVGNTLSALGSWATTTEGKTSPVNWGVAFDAGLGFKLGPGYIMMDVRYMLDLNETKARAVVAGETVEKGLFTRRSLNVGLGYELVF